MSALVLTFISQPLNRPLAFCLSACVVCVRCFANSTVVSRRQKGKEKIKRRSLLPTSFAKQSCQKKYNPMFEKFFTWPSSLHKCAANYFFNLFSKSAAAIPSSSQRMICLQQMRWRLRLWPRDREQKGERKYSWSQVGRPCAGCCPLGSCRQTNSVCGKFWKAVPYSTCSSPFGPSLFKPLSQHNVKLSAFFVPLPVVIKQS